MSKMSDLAIRIADAEGLGEQPRFVIHEDPGHSYLECTLLDLLKSEVATKVSNCSYIFFDKKLPMESRVFLEEDSDMPLFLDNLTKVIPTFTEADAKYYVKERIPRFYNNVRIFHRITSYGVNGRGRQRETLGTPLPIWESSIVEVAALLWNVHMNMGDGYFIRPCRVRDDDHLKGVSDGFLHGGTIYRIGKVFSFVYSTKDPNQCYDPVKFQVHLSVQIEDEPNELDLCVSFKTGQAPGLAMGDWQWSGSLAFGGDNRHKKAVEDNLTATAEELCNHARFWS